MQKRLISFIKDFLEISASVILIFTFLTFVLGEGAGAVSSLFRLGSSGIAVESLFQLFLLAFTISLFKLIFLTDAIIKTLGGLVRYVLFFGLSTIFIMISAFCFKWISNELKYWLIFLACYVLSTAISIIVSNLINKKEDEKLNAALKVIKGN
ncbi:MAG: hypothetical protein J5710_05410 [Treponema sp.]|nr:hypothetical protein [Treponema sp.]MBR5645868.1 hypothetical protein [Treponema sp.]